MFRENLENAKRDVNENLTKIKQEGFIDETEFLLLHDRLIADCDSCLNSKESLSCAQINGMAAASLEKFENIKMNEDLISVIMMNYSTIASANQVRTLNFTAIGEYCNPGSVIWPWYESRQTLADKYEVARNRVKHLMNATFEKITTEKVNEVVQRAYADINKIEQDSTLSDQAVKDIINLSLEASKAPEMEMMYTHLVGNIYHVLSDIKKIDDGDIKKYLTDLENNPERKPLSDQALEHYVYKRLDFMLEEGLVDKSDYDVLKKYMIADVHAFLHGNESKGELIKRVKTSLPKFEKMELDTEDREFIAETYYDIATRKDIDIAEILNKWLYW